MLASRLPWPARSWHSLAATASVAALALPVAVVHAPLAARPVLRLVSYRGYSFDVPGSWPVVDLARHRRDCVRFDRHAVYLGTPGRNESCPSRLAGTTEAMVIQPADARSLPSSVENPVARRIAVTAARMSVTATFDADPTQVYQILASALLPAPIIEAPSPPAAAVRHGAVTSMPLAARAGVARMAAPALSARIASYHGLGFDTCTAPSTAYMRAWRLRSPYRAVGVYIGGSDEACAQANLTAGWLRRESADGWHFLPMYVGPQAAFGELSPTPGRQGRAAADDAVTQAERLGLGQGTPIYYDMEGYPPGQTAAVLRLESAWTTTLHAFGYSSGIYSSSSSGITDLARQYFGRKYAMPDVSYDALWNGKANTRDSVYRAGEWANHQRAHQFAGNAIQAFGADAMNVDQDFMNVALPLRGEPPAAGPSGFARTSRDSRGRRPSRLPLG